MITSECSGDSRRSNGGERGRRTRSFRARVGIVLFTLLASSSAALAGMSCGSSSEPVRRAQLELVAGAAGAAGAPGAGGTGGTSAGGSTAKGGSAGSSGTGGGGGTGGRTTGGTGG